MVDREGPRGFADLSHLSEEHRIQVIGDYAMEHPGSKLAVCVDSKDTFPGKTERYLEKFKAMYPLVEVVEVRNGGAAFPGVDVVVLTYNPKKETKSNGSPGIA